jgi:restriction system protein
MPRYQRRVMGNVDGERRVQRLKELGLGVKITMIESVEVNTDWFTKI